MRLPSLLLLSAGLCSAALHAQVNIRSSTTSTTDAPNGTAHGLSYQNTTKAVTSFTGGGSTYYASTIADAAYALFGAGSLAA